MKKIMIRKNIFKKVIGKKHGFTLIELVVVIAMIIIITAIATPNFLSFIKGYRLKSAAQDIYSNLQLAKISAIKTGSNCTITYNTAQNTYTISGAMTKTVDFTDYGSGVTYQGPSGFTSVTSITFNSRGLCSGSFGYVYLSNGDNTTYYRIGTLIAGVVKMQKYNGGTWQ